MAFKETYQNIFQITESNMGNYLLMNLLIQKKVKMIKQKNPSGPHKRHVQTKQLYKPGSECQERTQFLNTGRNPGESQQAKIRGYLSQTHFH